MKNFYFIFVLAMMLGCSTEGLPPGDRAGGFKIVEVDQREIILANFKSNNIPFVIDEKGFINYLLQDQSEVLGIIRDVKTGGKLDSSYYESTILQDEKAKEKYVSEFKAQNIPFDISDHSGIVHISWSQKYGSDVDKIRQKIDLELRHDARKRAVAEGRAPASLIVTPKD